MTTPSVDLNIVMPYGVTVRSKGTVIPSLVGTHPKQNNNVSLRLPAGPCRVAASWEGTEEMRLVVQNQAEATSRTVATIASGGGGAHRHGLCRGCRGRLGVPLRSEINRNHRHHRGLPAQLRVARRAQAVV